MKIGDKVVCVSANGMDELVHYKIYTVTIVHGPFISVMAHAGRLFRQDRFLKIEESKDGYVVFVRDKKEKIDHMALVRQIALEWRE